MFGGNLPGSKGHSLSLPNSAGVFPVRTQLELRSIIGILQEIQTRKIILVNHRSEAHLAPSLDANKQD